MNIQDAYKKLDLAKGLNFERVESQYQNLKAELEPKISGTQNERLKQVYTNRLDEVEQAYAVLNAHFEDGTAEVVQKVNPVTELSDFSPKNIPVQEPKKKTGRIVGLLFLVLVIIAAPLIYFNSDVFAEEEEIDLFRKMEGELQVFVNNLTLRQYPDSKSAKIEVFPLGTRLFYDQNENPKTDDKNRVWRKVRVIHPVYGWDRPDERFPYPFEGWMVTEQCDVTWVEDSIRTANLLSIFGNNEGGALIQSTYRHGLADYFKDMNYFGDWFYYGENKSSKLQNAVSVNWGFSSKDCNGDNQSDLIIALRNTNDQKILLMSTDSYGNAQVVNNIDFSREKFGMRKLTAQELKSLNRSTGFYLKNAIYMDRNGDDNILFEERGELYTIYWSGIKK
jgi:hypothetical protein